MKLKYLMFNLKSNLDLKELLKYKEFITNYDFSKYNLILFPANIYLPFFYNTSITLGVQNISLYETEILTDVILPRQLKSLKVKYTLLNHAEVNDTLNNIILKIRIASKNRIKIVLIIGEKEQTNKEETLIYLKEQINIIFSNLSLEEIKNIIIAYEPSWLINQNFSINLNDLTYLIDNLKNDTKNTYKMNIPIIYGGSINDKNFKNISKLDNLDGYLIGNSCKNEENVVKLLSSL